MINNTPYTYLIGWPNLNKWYYGVRYAKNCQPTDLWNPYKTSSKLVKKLITLHGEPSVVEIRKTFQSIAKAQQWEAKVLKRLHVINDTKWVNGHNTRAFDPTTVPRGQSHWTKKDTIAAIKWKNRDGWKNRKEWKNNGTNISGINHWTAKDTDAAKKHQDRMNGEKNPNNSLAVKEKKSKYLRENNPVFKEGVREKISKALLGKKRPRKCCEYCKKDIADSIYTKFHGDKCKHRVV